MQSFRIIQGGMGVGVSGWKLARVVSRLGQLGVVSGTGLAVVLARRLQDGDSAGDVRRAIGHFPVAGVGDRVLHRYFIPGGKPKDQPYVATPIPQLHFCQELAELTVLANFVEVFLAKEGHAGAVGINYLEKIQLPTAPSLFGAMLAGVDVVLMGAGIPRQIPGMLDGLAAGKQVAVKLDVIGAGADDSYATNFDPAAFCGGSAPTLRRPDFLAIVASATLAMTLARKSNGRVDGFVIEGPTAGGHNAPPRGAMQLNDAGEPIYGPRDEADLARFRELGLPFWLAGGYGQTGRLADALLAGAQGIQVGTAFAFCEESGLATEIKSRVLQASRDGSVRIRTDPQASPTGYPFKVVQLSGTLSDADVYSDRPRLCDLGYLRHLYRREDGSIGYRCPAESGEQYAHKGGDPADTAGRKCICNALFAAIGMGQVHTGSNHEPPIVTAGDEVQHVSQFLKPGNSSYSAEAVLQTLLADSAA